MAGATPNMVTFRGCFWKFRWASPSVIYGSPPPPPPQGQDCLLGRSGDIPRKLAKLCCVKLLFTHAKHISVVCFVHMFTFSFLNWFSLLLWKLVERGGGQGSLTLPPALPTLWTAENEWTNSKKKEKVLAIYFEISKFTELDGFGCIISIWRTLKIVMIRDQYGLERQLPPNHHEALTGILMIFKNAPQCWFKRGKLVHLLLQWCTILISETGPPSIPQLWLPPPLHKF